MIRRLFALLALTLALSLVACTPPAQVGDVTVTPSSATLEVGDTVDFTATVEVVRGSPNTAVTWTSGNATIASVDEDGTVTANAAGTTTITATSVFDTDASGSATITVTEPEPELESIAATAAAAGSFTTLLAALEAADLDSLFADDEAGPFTVFAPTDDAFADLLAFLDATPEELLAREDLLDILQYHVVAGEVLAADILDLIDAGDGSAEIETLNGALIIVTLDGTNVLLNGEIVVDPVDILATNGVIHVIDGVLLPPAVDPEPDPDVIDGVSVTPETENVVVGGTVQLTATVSVVSGAPSTDVTWESDDDTVATVDTDGLVTAVAEGTATITATSVFDTDFSGSAEVEVFPTLVFVDETNYETYAAPASIANEFELAFPAFTGGLGPFTFDLDGDLPVAFVPRVPDGDAFVPGDVSYEIGLDEATGAIGGATGFPGVFTGNVTVTDALGQSLTAEYTLDLGIAFRYTLAADLATTADTFSYPIFEQPGPFFIVPGIQVEISGVQSIPGTPPVPSIDLLPGGIEPGGFLEDFEFLLDYVDSNGSPTEEVIGDGQLTGTFRINVNQGSIGRYTSTPTITQWFYEVTVSHPDASENVVYPVRFHFTGAPFDD